MQGKRIGSNRYSCAQGFFGEDCSNEAEHLQYGVPVTKAAASFEYDFFQLPEISPAMLTHSVEVRVRASFSSEGYGEWAAARPELLLLKACPLLCQLCTHPDCNKASEAAARVSTYT